MSAPGEHEQLIDACRHGYRELVAALIAEGVDVDAPRNGNGVSPLLVACLYGNSEIASMLLSAGALIDRAGSGGITALSVACQDGHAETISTLLAAGASVNQADRRGYTALFRASVGGHTDIVAALLAAGASVNQAAHITGYTPLFAVCLRGHTETAEALLAAGANVNQADHDGLTPLFAACQEGHVGVTQLLSSYSANRQVHPDLTAEEAAAFSNDGHGELTAWLVGSRQWCTPLHHLRIVEATRARALLRDGADLHAAAAPGGPTPLSLARGMDAAGDVADGSTAHLVLQAAKPWSEATHGLFPLAERERAAALLRVGWELSRQARFSGEEMALFDLWREHVVPYAVVRRSGTTDSGSV